jgi:hypothetical protein
MAIRGFDPKELEKLREVAKMAAAMPNVPGIAGVPGSPGGPRPAPDPNAPPATVYRIAPPPSGTPPGPPPAAGIRRVLVGAVRTPMVRRDLAGIATAISDSLRRAIAARPGYDAVDAATLTDPRVYASRSRTALARAVGAGAALTSLFYPRADSTIVLQLQLFDVQRNRVVRVMESKPINTQDPMGGVADLVSATLAALDQVDWRPMSADSVGLRRPDFVPKPD